jgi:hypothetical protein
MLRLLRRQRYKAACGPAGGWFVGELRMGICRYGIIRERLKDRGVFSVNEMHYSSWLHFRLSEIRHRHAPPILQFSSVDELGFNTQFHLQDDLFTMTLIA